MTWNKVGIFAAVSLNEHNGRYFHFYLLSAKPSPPRNVRIKEVYKDYIIIEWDTPEKDGGESITVNFKASLGNHLKIPALNSIYTDSQTFT